MHLRMYDDRWELCIEPRRDRQLDVRELVVRLIAPTRVTDRDGLQDLSFRLSSDQLMRQHLREDGRCESGGDSGNDDHVADARGEKLPRAHFRSSEKAINLNPNLNESSKKL